MLRHILTLVSAYIFQPFEYQENAVPCSYHRKPGLKQQDATEMNTIGLSPCSLAVTEQLIQFWQITLTIAIQAEKRSH